MNRFGSATTSQRIAVRAHCRRRIGSEMASSAPTNERTYYEYLPHTEHACGDIWVGLPTLGLLPYSAVSGLVITPACDLSNRKTDTVTYLPIVPVVSYFLTGAEIPDITSKIRNLCSGAKYSPVSQWRDDQRRPPISSELERDIENIKQRLGAPRLSVAEATALGRALGGFRALKEPHGVDTPRGLASLFGADWEKMLTRIVSNAYSNDLHFLPADLQDAAFSGVFKHSVVLFRYPITLPSAILDMAMSASPEIWKEMIAEHSPSIPMLGHFSSHLPFKALTLKSSFRADLLTRYVALYNRIGSPDFSHTTVARFVADIRG